MLAICVSSEKLANKTFVIPQKVICRQHKFRKGTLINGSFRSSVCPSGLVLLLQMGTVSSRLRVTSASLEWYPCVSKMVLGTSAALMLLLRTSVTEEGEGICQVVRTHRGSCRPQEDTQPVGLPQDGG